MSSRFIPKILLGSLPCVSQMTCRLETANWSLKEVFTRSAFPVEPLSPQRGGGASLARCIRVSIHLYTHRRLDALPRHSACKAAEKQTKSQNETPRFFQR